MENMDKGFTVPKWVLIVWLKIPQMPQNLSAQFVCPSPKVLDFIEKRLHWASVVRGFFHFSISKKKAKSHSFPAHMAILFATDCGRPMKPFFTEIQNFWAWADKLDK